MVLPILYILVKGLGCQVCELRMSWIHVSCKLQWAVNWCPDISIWAALVSWDSIIVFPIELCRAASVKTIELGPYELLSYLYYKKNKPHFIILQNVNFVNRVLQAGIKKEDNCLPTYHYSIMPRQNIRSPMWAVNYLDKLMAGLEIIRGAALLLHLLKETILE